MPNISGIAGLCLMVLIIIFVPCTARGDSRCGLAENASGKKLKNLTLRKTFDGSSKDEAKPASVGYENPDSGDDYILLDAALRWDALECSFADTGLILAPVIEAHRSEYEVNPVKKTAVKIEAELWRGLLAGKDGIGGASFLPRVKLEYGQTRDSIKHKNSSKAAMLVAFESNMRSRPNGWQYWDCDIQAEEDGEVAGSCPGKFRWWPNLGVEYYDSLPVERTGLSTIDRINTTVGVARLGIEYWPLLLGRSSTAPNSPLQMLIEFTYRPRIGGDELPEGDPNLLTAGLTYYFDAAQAIGLGLEYEDGQGPLRNFRDEERTTLSLRVKF